MHSDRSHYVKDYVLPVHTTIYSDMTVDEAIESLRNRTIDEKFIYFYVIDRGERLKGVVSSRHLVLSNPTSFIYEIMKDIVVALNEDQTLEEAMEELAKHRMLALPVVDKKGRLIGMIDIQLYLEESVDTASSQRRSDAFQLLGLTLEEGKRKTPWKSYRIRMPWIACNMLGGVACAVISKIFSLVLGQVLLLAMFIPLILTLSESISMQSMTQSFYLLRKSRLSWRTIALRALSEWKIIVLLSLTSGILVGAISLLWGSGILPSLTIATGLTLSINVSATVGACIPFILHSTRLDPKVAAGPVILMFTDVTTTAIYLSIATWWLL